ncbi:MAG TPA: TAT-variant-translocated molybdopterin oxidoreductase [Saprospiraceae bacterium]|nr:TAT-variant-translocated molybdopterin oxidoreductase [Saprospiraceae bacterium]HNG88569.1 TAT-variant-translocated molybdopterin oxidoreductase [Saprospiraceae bacterium]
MNNGIWVSTEDLTRDESFVRSSEQEFSVDTISEHGDRWATGRRDFLKLLGFGLGAATVAASCEIPVKKAIPYVTKPDSIVPGVANYFASSFVQGGDYCSILVKTREGRPIKIEGNSLSSVTKGGTSARAQASVLSLYDTKRIPHAGNVADGQVSKKGWAELDREIKAKLAGGNIRIISGTNISPTAMKALDEFKAKYPNTAVYTYDPVSAAALLAANEQCFGIRGQLNYDFSKAQIIVSFGADFLGTWGNPIENARSYAAGRKVAGNKNPAMSRHYQVESGMSLSGSKADNRILVKPSEQGAAIAALYNALSGGSGGPKLNDKAAAAINKVAAELRAAAGKSIVISGSNNVAEQVIVNKINDLLGNLGQTITGDAPLLTRQGDERSMARLIAEMESGQVATVIVWGANPAWELPNAAQFKAAFAKVGTRISFNTTLDETTALCTHAVPMHHQLESWGDAQPKAGYYSFIQPTIAPLFQTRQAEHSLLEWADSANLSRQDAQPYYQYLKAHWVGDMFGQQTQYATPAGFWDMLLHDGVFENPAAGGALAFNAGVSPDVNAVSQPAGGEVEMSFYETVNIGGGQYAHNPWLQEMPDPVTRTVWGNYLSIPLEWDGINKINGWKGLNDGDIVDVEVNGQKLNCTVVRTFGQMPGTVALALGGGREAGGCGTGYGVNVNPVLKQEGGLTQYFAGSVNVSGKVGVDKDFACVQHHHTMGVKSMGKEENAEINVDEKTLGWKGFQGSLTDRSILFHANLKELPEFSEKMVEFHKESTHLNNETLYPNRDEYFSTGVKWGMYVDMNACVGCGACQVACVSENNVPVVGKKEVHRHHEMTWMRIDRYFYGDFENPRVAYQPMMCQHCDNAPCENVCPVNATNHSMEGINQMAYNRCIGTRYCANNCPYKVRRFNWLDYTTADVWPYNEERVFTAEGDDKPFYADNLVRMVLNPDVTVRTRGVIEKCTLCIQRIQEGKLTAKRENRALMDNDVRSACQTACPTGAIVFGNTNDPNSAVSKARKAADELAYAVLEEINVRPVVKYSALVTNSNEELFS